MKIIFTFIVFIITSISIHSQNKDLQIDYLKKGNTLFRSTYINTRQYPNIELKKEQKRNLTKALECYKKYINLNIEKEIPLKVYQNIGLIYNELKDDKKAIVYLKKVFNNTKSIYFLEIVSENLMNIHFQNNEFNKALLYANVYFKRTRFSSCGNGNAETAIYKAFTYGKIYYGLKEYKKALEFLLPEIFYNGMVDNRKLVKLTTEVLFEKYKKKKVKKIFEKALNDIYLKKYKKTNYYYTKILNVTIPIADLKDLVEKDNGKFKLLKKDLQKSEILKSINSK